MEKNLYIDASHPDETRIVLKSDNGIEEYEYEDKNKLNYFVSCNYENYKYLKKRRKKFLKLTM